MSKQPSSLRNFLRMSLANRVTVMLIFASLLPLLIIVISSELQSRPVLTAQASETMNTDAQTHVRLIDEFFHAQFALAATVSQNPTIHEFLTGQATNSTDALNVLAAIYRTNVHFNGCALFNPQGHLLLSSPTVPQKHGAYLFPPDDLQQITAHPLTLISPVFYDPVTDQESVDLYVPIQTLFGKMLGIVRITLSIDYVQQTVTGELNANGQGSYAFILDPLGVRIADTNPSQRFSAIAPLTAQIQQRVQTERIYGATGNVLADNDSALTAIQQSAHPPLSFQIQPAGQHTLFQVTRIGLSSVPWTYFVLAPLNGITTIADQQLQSILIVACVVLLLVILLGLLVGRGMARPIMFAVEALNTNNKALNLLAQKQQTMAKEEQWIVEAAQVGLQSIEYYTEATNTAAQELRAISTGLLQGKALLNQEQAQKTLQQILVTSQYISKAAKYQLESRKKMESAIRVMKQVNTQLTEGANDATHAASQEEKVVKNLQNIVE